MFLKECVFILKTPTLKQSLQHLNFICKIVDTENIVNDYISFGKSEIPNNPLIGNDNLKSSTGIKVQLKI